MNYLLERGLGLGWKKKECRGGSELKGDADWYSD
jgi:hypothetical protein